MATAGKIPPFLAMWAPNLALLAIGIWLMTRANRETGARRSDANWMRRLFTALSSRRNGRAQASSEVESNEGSSILNRLDITFPNILDRYVLREFLKVLLLVLLSVAALIVIVDYTQISGDVRDNHIAFHTVFAYYRFMVFQILHWTLPISVLVATLVTFGIMSKNNEVTAIKSTGVSLFRVALPIIGIAALVSLVAYLNLDFVLPYSNQRMDYLKKKIKGQVVYGSSSQQKVWFRGKGQYLINFLSYDRNAKELSQVQVFDYSEKPSDFATEAKAPEEMTFAQLREYIETIRNSGYSAEDLTVKLYEKTSWPVISIVMALIALPFAFTIGKRGALYGISVALVLGLVYWVIFAIFTKFGEVGNLPGALSAWSANILFAIAATYMFLHIKT